MGVQLADIADKAAVVGQINIMAAGGDTGARDAVVLALEGAAGMNHQVGFKRCQPGLKVGGVQVQRCCFQAGARRALQLGLQLLRWRAAPPGDDQRDIGGVCQRLGDALTKVAVAAKNQNALTAHGSSRNSARLRT